MGDIIKMIIYCICIMVILVAGISEEVIKKNNKKRKQVSKGKKNNSNKITQCKIQDTPCEVDIRYNLMQEFKEKVQLQIQQDHQNTYFNEDTNILLFRKKYGLLPKQEVYTKHTDNIELGTLSIRNTHINRGFTADRGYSIQEVV